MNLKEGREAFMGVFGERKEKETRCNYIIISQIKEIKKQELTALVSGAICSHALPSRELTPWH